MIIPDEIIIAIASSLATYLGSWFFTKKKENEIKAISELLEDVIAALCNSNGMGERFKTELDYIRKLKEDYKQRVKNKNQG